MASVSLTAGFKAAWLVALLLFSLFCYAGNEGSRRPLALVIEKAFEFRTSSMAKFTSLLEELRGRNTEATPRQRDQIAYLFAFQQYLTGNVDFAVDTYNELLLKDPDAELKLLITTSLANIYLLKGDLEQAFSLGLNVVSDEYEVLPMQSRVRSIITVAYFFLESGLYAQAEKLYRMIPDIKMNDQDYCMLQSQKVLLDYRLGRLADNQDVYRQSRQYCHQKQEILTATITDYYVASNLLELGKADEATALLEEITPIALDTGYSTLIASVYASLAKAYVSNSNADIAIKTAYQALQYAEKSTYIEARVIAYKALSDAYYLIDKPNEMRLNLERHHEQYKLMVDKQRSGAVAYHAVNLRTQRQAQRAEELDRQVAKLKLAQQLSDKEKENRNLLLALLTMLVLLGAAWARRTRREHLSLKQQAQTDALTGVLNRHHATLLMEDALSTAKSLAHDVGFILLDLDKFKLINDRFGHPSGDWALQQAATRLKQVARRGDLIGRFGGEEFAILLPGCDLASSQRIAEKYRRALASIDTSIKCDDQGSTFSITGSFGVTTAEKSGYDLSRLMSDADQAMYQAKDQGRNQVVFYQLAESRQT